MSRHYHHSRASRDVRALAILLTFTVVLMVLSVVCGLEKITGVVSGVAVEQRQMVIKPRNSNTAKPLPVKRKARPKPQIKSKQKAEGEYDASGNAYRPVGGPH